VTYARGWRKLEPLWDVIIRARRVSTMLPVLEQVLTGLGVHHPQKKSGESLSTLPLIKQVSG
jgi:hypothetical protein